MRTYGARRDKSLDGIFDRLLPQLNISTKANRFYDFTNGRSMIAPTGLFVSTVRICSFCPLTRFAGGSRRFQASMFVPRSFPILYHDGNVFSITQRASRIVVSLWWRECNTKYNKTACHPERQAVPAPNSRPHTVRYANAHRGGSRRFQ